MLVIKGWLLLSLTLLCGSYANAQQSTRVAFGCCFDHSERQLAFDALTHADPEAFVFLGNALDVNAGDMDDLLDAYDVFNRFRAPKVLRRQSAVLSVWNLKDYRIDGKTGANNPLKYAVRNHYLTFWREPATSSRMFQQHGIAKAIVLGSAPQRVQIIVLDGRWNRDPLPRVGWFERQMRKFDHKQGPYLSNPGGQLLGEEQWQWLAAELEQPAEVRIIMSATPFFAPQNGYDSWSMYPKAQQRLVELLTETKPNGLLLAVGDRGFGELSKVTDVLPYPLWQITAGSIESDDTEPYPSEYRQGPAITQARYGQIEVIWSETPDLRLSLQDVDGRALHSQTLSLSQLQISQ
ncbi:alkaline phosphatase D family protein [Idiomarina seosinensis]|uniref:alkaline phosphatase D family protein n=1 Tax=Idiomarina seosinensis TaxID=281739 RepID=UPI003850893E